MDDPASPDAHQAGSRGLAQTLALQGPDRGATPFRSILFSRTDDFRFTSADGRLTTRQFQLDRTGLRISRVTSTGHRVSLTEDADASILLPRSGALHLRIAGRTHDLPAGRAALMPPQTRQTRAIPDGTGTFVGDVLLLPKTALDALSESIGATTPPADFLLLDRAGIGRLSSGLALMLATLDRHGHRPGQAVLANTAALLRDMLAEMLATRRDEDPPVSSAGEHDRVRRAEDLIRARAHEPYAIADVANDLGIGLRSLQLSFRRINGLTPREYQARVRLDLVRLRLLTADPERDRVTDIALDCGFTHLGRFSNAYFRTFGERPSQTLGRRP